MPPDRFAQKWLQIETSHDALSASRSATSFRGSGRLAAEFVRSSDAVIHPPALWLGALLATAGSLTLALASTVFLPTTDAVPRYGLFVLLQPCAGKLRDDGAWWCRVSVGRDLAWLQRRAPSALLQPTEPARHHQCQALRPATPGYSPRLTSDTVPPLLTLEWPCPSVLLVLCLHSCSVVRSLGLAVPPWWGDLWRRSSCGASEQCLLIGDTEACHRTCTGANGCDDNSPVCDAALKVCRSCFAGKTRCVLLAVPRRHAV